MKLKDGKCVQWHDGEQFHVGKLMVVEYEPNEFVLSFEEGITFTESLESDESILVKHSHTGELEFVDNTMLSPYPTEPIPTP